MNILKGKISAVKVQGNLSLINIRVGTTTLTAIVIETPKTAPFLEIGRPIEVLFKETEVIIGKGNKHLVSLQNKFYCTVRSIEKGVLLSKLNLAHKEGSIISVITRNAVDKLNITVGEEVTAMVKTNEILLRE